MKSMKLGCCLAGGLLTGYLAPAAGEEPTPVVTLPLTKQVVAETFTAWGEVEETPQQLHFEIDGNLVELAAGEGEQVKAGQLLARLDTTAVEIRLRQAQTALALADKQVERSRALKRTDMVGQEQLDAVISDQALKRLAVEGVEEEQRKHFLRAPADGRILRRLADYPGPLAVASPLFVFKSSATPWRATVAVAGQHLAALKVGASLELEIPALPELRVTGKVDRIAGSALTQSGLFPVDIILSEGSASLRAGMQLKARFTVAERAGYPVPLNAFYRIRGEQGSLFVTGGEHREAHRVEVDLGSVEGTSALVTTDLSGYDAVITQGQQQLKDGTPIEMRRDLP